MKKITISVLMLIIAIATFSQQTKSSLGLTKEDYLQKSNNKKKVAWIMLGGGATLVLTGIIIPKGELTNDGCLFCPEYKKEYKNDGIKGSLAFTGTLSMLGSIPFFISSHHNKKKAASLSFKNEMVPGIYKSSLVYNSIPSLDLKFKL
jgi:hypothetical protein